MKLNTITSLTAAGLGFLGLGSAQATTIIWDNGGSGSSWQTDNNWDTDTEPTAVDDVTITTSDNLSFNPAFGGDHLTIDGGSVTINGGSLTQSVSYGEDLFINNGTLTLNNTQIEWVHANAQMFIARNQDDTGTINATNSTIISGGEIWFGHTDGATNQDGFVNLTNSNIEAKGGVGIWFWDSDATGNDFKLNINGAGSSVEGRIGRRSSASNDNSVTWETLWNEGILQFNGANTGSFADHFTTSGTAGTTGYSLTSVPEPSSTVLIGLSGLALIIRRRK